MVKRRTILKEGIYSHVDVKPFNKAFPKGKRMQLATKSFLGLCLICSTAGAVEPATPATPPTAASTQNAKPAPTSATVAKPATTTAPTTTQPLTAEQIAKNKQQQDAKLRL